MAEFWTLGHMKFVATSNYLIAGKIFVAKGEVVSYDDDQLIGQLRAAGRLADFGTEQAARIQAEVVAEKKRDKRDKREPWTFDRRLVLYGIIVAILGVVAYLVFR
jgi:hypothetical protein